MQKILPLLVALFALLALSSNAQQWGYVTLIAKQNTNTVSLIDTNSAVVKQWTGLSGNTAYSSYMMEGGDLWRTVSASGASFSGGGMAGRVQKVSWNGTILFDYQVSNTQECSHHDICPLPNGNVLLIVYEKKTAAQVQQAGATVNAIRWSEKIIELHPTGTNTAEIVWQWNLWDHLVQNLYPAKSNYQTSIVQHPELLNINYNNNTTDWVHMNGIDYNAALNQIVVSSHNLNELWVIDHSTTTAEAATHTGGNSGRGGDILYRWGNPAAYGATGSAVFNVVHDAHWVPEGCPRAGWLGGFNNRGVSSSVSAIDLFQAPWNGTSYTHTAGQAYTPATYGYRHPANGYSSNMGNSQQLPNGNMLVCLATASKVYEINSSGTQLWQYTSTGAIPQAWRYSRCYMESPKANVVTANPTLCAGGSVQLDITPAASGANNFTYEWAPATGLSSTTVQDPLVSGISSSTVYTVTVTTAGGCSVTATVPVSVTPGPVADAGADVTAAPGQSTTLTATGGDTYQWSHGTNTASTTVSPTTTTTYTVTVTVNGCTGTDEVTVLVSDPPVVQATASLSSICLGGSVQLSVHATGGTGNYSYQWSSTPAGFSSTLSNPVVTPSVNTTYTVQVSDGVGSTTASVDVSVHPLPVADAGNDVSVLIGTSATLIASGGTTYLWSTGATTESITVSPALTTTYSVVVTNAQGCTSSDAVTVTVTGSVLSSVVEALDNTLCTGDSTRLSVVASGGTGNYTYTWTANGIYFSSVRQPVVAPAENTLYEVTVGDGIGSINGAVSIQVNPLPAVDAGNDVSILIGTSTTLTASGTGAYSWNTGESTASITVSPVSTTTYTVSVTNSNGCTGTDAVEVVVSGTYMTATAGVSDSLLCLGESAQLNAVASGGSGNYTYSWSANGVFFSSLPNPVIHPQTLTTYVVSISDGITTVEEAILVLIAAQPLVDAGSDVTITKGSSTTLTASSTGNTYSWSTGATTASITVSPTSTTLYTVTVTNASGCSASDQVLVTVSEFAPLTATISAADTVICYGDVTQLFVTATGGSGTYTYTWLSNPLGFTSNLPDPFINPDVTTTYTVLISDGISQIGLTFQVLVNQLPNQPSIERVGETLVSSSTVNNQWFYYGNPVVDATGQVYAPTQNGSYQVQIVDANGCYSPLSDPYEFIMTATHQVLSDTDWDIAPNPASTVVRILGDFDEMQAVVEIWNSTGGLAVQASGTKTIAVSELPSGAYLLRVNTARGTGLRKLIILR